MKLQDARDSYYYYSEKLSDITRYLGLAGIGIIWIFRVGESGKLSLPRDLICPTILLIAGLGLDLLHYIAGSLVWGIFHRHKEKKITEDAEFKAPKELNWVTLFFFWFKIIPIIGAYYLMLTYLFKILSS
jgi:hypothetical protein